MVFLFKNVLKFEKIVTNSTRSPVVVSRPPDAERHHSAAPVFIDQPSGRQADKKIQFFQRMPKTRYRLSQALLFFVYKQILHYLTKRSLALLNVNILKSGYTLVVVFVHGLLVHIFPLRKKLLAMCTRALHLGDIPLFLSGLLALSVCATHFFRKLQLHAKL